jgi:hypothetical protein
VGASQTRGKTVTPSLCSLIRRTLDCISSHIASRPLTHVQTTSAHVRTDRSMSVESSRRRRPAISGVSFTPCAAKRRTDLVVQCGRRQLVHRLWMRRSLKMRTQRPASPLLPTGSREKCDLLKFKLTVDVDTIHGKTPRINTFARQGLE